MLVTLAEDHDAPHVFSKKWKRKPLAALGLTTGGMIISILMSLLMPDEVYEYITTAAGLLLLYNWMFILITSGRLLDLNTWGQIKRFAGMALIVIAVSGTLFHKTSMPGFWVSLGFVVIIGVVTLLKKQSFKRLQPEVKPEPNQG
jgi:aromatic amino acid permease